MSLVSVVFPAFNNAPLLRGTLPRILDQDLPADLRHEVVLVDDGSEAETAAWIDAQSHPALRLVRLPANRGRSAARNAGVRAAQGEAVIFLDSDVRVVPGFVAAHARSLGLGQGPLPPRLSLGKVVDCDLSSGEPPSARLRGGLPHFTTANVAIPLDLLRKVSETTDGPFDERTFSRYGWEDLELEQRLRAAGASRRPTPQAVGFHHVPPFHPDQLPALLRKERDRAAMAKVFWDKHPNLEVRLMIQRTPLHRGLWELLSLGGLLNERRLSPLLRRLSEGGRPALAGAIARVAILNPTYVRSL